MGNTKPVASSECFKLKPTDNQAFGVKKCEQEAYRVSFSAAERHKSTTSTSSSSIFPPSRARSNASALAIFAKTFLMSVVLAGLLAVEVGAGSVLVSVNAEGKMNVAGGKVDDADGKVGVPDGKVYVAGGKVDVTGG